MEQVRIRTTPRSFLGLILTLLCGCTGGEERPSVLLITLDTTRADALSCMGGTPGTTPHIDRLAGQGVLYTNAHTVAPLTLPAHASMLTGLYPLRHGLRDNGIGTLPPDAFTVAEAAAEAGYSTAAFIAALVLDGSFGLSQGFERYEGPPRPAQTVTSHIAELPARTVVDRAIEHLRGTSQEEAPFFLWVHLFDPHYPYEPPAAFAERFPGQPYLGEVAAVDDEVGRLLASLEELGRDRETLVLLVADHGEAFGEHEESTHGAYCWQTTLRVPLVLRYPDGRDAGRVSDEVVSVVDVYPTILEAMGLEPVDVDGTSLFDRRVPTDRGVYFESYTGYLSYGWSPLSGWLDAQGKYLHSSAPLFFDLGQDPGETADLSELRADELGRYRRAIGEVADRPALTSPGSGADAEMLAAIRGLGYAAGGGGSGSLPHPLAPSDGPSPHDMVRQDSLALQTMELNNSGRHAQAEAAALQILRTNDRNWFALDQLSLALMRMGRLDEAIDPLERLLADGPPWPHVPFKLGNCLAGEGRWDEAARAFSRAVELDPANPQARERLATCLEKLGRLQEAKRIRGSG